MRRTELDLCRIAGCLLVLMAHTGAEIYQQCPIDSLNFTILNFFSSAARTSVPLFFMLSGALMLTRERLNLKKLLLNHALFLTGLYYLWSFAYALLGRIVSGNFGTLYDFVYSVVCGHYHLWFIPAMVICYLFMPVVHSAIHGVKLDGRYLVGLFFGLVLLTANMNLTPDPAPILHQITLNFSLDYIIYMGYVIWGWWLSTRQLPKNSLWISLLVFLLGCGAAALGNQWYSLYKGEADGWLFSFFSATSFIQTTALFCFFLALRGRQFRKTKLISKLSDCTLGVYFIHPLMINVLELAGLSINAETPIKDFAVFYTVLAVSCFALAFVAKRIPVVKKLL